MKVARMLCAETPRVRPNLTFAHFRTTRSIMSGRHVAACLGRGEVLIAVRWPEENPIEVLYNARSRERLTQHLDLLRCHYNLIRPHSSLRFGLETRTPAMLAGLARRKLRFRDVFGVALLALVFALVQLANSQYEGTGAESKCAA